MLAGWLRGHGALPQPVSCAAALKLALQGGLAAISCCSQLAVTSNNAGVHAPMQGTLVAIKLLLSVDERGQERFRAEVETVAALRHPK